MKEDQEYDLVFMVGKQTWEEYEVDSILAKQDKFVKVVIIYVDTLWHVALKLSRDNVDLAKRLVRQTLEQAQQKFDSFDGEYIKPWLLTLLRQNFLACQ